MTSERPTHPRPPRRRRTHPARSARVLATGVSISAVLALTAAMGISARTPSTAPVPVTASVRDAGTASSQAPRPRRVVIVHRTVVVPAPADSGAGRTVVPPATPAPRTAAKAPAPAAAPPAPQSNATTGGSR